jgi:cell division protein FtsB
VEQVQVSCSGGDRIMNLADNLQGRDHIDKCNNSKIEKLKKENEELKKQIEAYHEQHKHATPKN